MDLKETYNQIAEDWHQDHKDDDWWIEGTEEFVSLFKTGDLVLDVGCAGGLKSRYLMDRGLKVVGIDLSEKMIDIAKRELPMGTFFALDLAAVDKLDYLFDGIFMQAVLLHVPKKEVSDKLEKIAGKLKPGGYFYIAVKKKRPQGSEEEIKEENDYGYPYERFFSYFTTEEIEGYLRNLGMEIVFSQESSHNNGFWIQVIGQKGI